MWYGNKRETAGYTAPKGGMDMEAKRITGTWFEFLHHNEAEGKYWNTALTAFSEKQWREKIREMKEAGMRYIALLATALHFKAYF